MIAEVIKADGDVITVRVQSVTLDVVMTLKFSNQEAGTFAYRILYMLAGGDPITWGKAADAAREALS